MRFSPAVWVGVLGVAFLFVLLRWNNFNAPLTRDEGEYAYAAQLLCNGGAPYEQSFLQKPPMVAYSYALAGLLAPEVFWSPRLLAGVFAALSTALLGWIARREFGPGAALPAMWLMTPMVLLPRLDQFIANTEMFMLLPLMGTVAVYVGCRRGKSGSTQWLAAGFLAGLTVCYKYTSIPLLAFVFAVWTFEEWHAGKSLRAIAGHWLCALAGGSVALAVALAPFLLRDGGKRLWECTIVFNRFYAAGSGFGLAGLWLKLTEFWGSWWFLFLAPGLLLFKPDRRVWFWGALFVMSWLVAAGSQYGHYYIAVMPFWALLVSVAFRGFAEWAAAKFSQPGDSIRLGLTALVVLGLCASDVPWLLRSRGQFAADRLGAWSPFLESSVVAAHVAQLTSDRDFVYVAGSEPQILCYAHRFSPTRFDIAYPLMIPTPLAKGYQAEAIRDLQQHPPAAIVFVRSPTSWLLQSGSPPEFLDFLRKLLAENYQIAGGCFFDGSQSQWREPLGAADMAPCSMLLFKRKVP